MAHIVTAIESAEAIQVELTAATLDANGPLPGKAVLPAQG